MSCRYQPRKKSGESEPLMEWFVKDRMRPDPRIDADVERLRTSP